ncbi:MAG: hypothetical protein AB8G99_13755 [Planctomycetaceae bacterium]
MKCFGFVEFPSGWMYGTDRDALYRWKSAKVVEIYHGDGKWVEYDPEDVNFSTDVTPIKTEEDLRAVVANMDGFFSGGSEIEWD